MSTKIISNTENNSMEINVPSIIKFTCPEYKSKTALFLPRLDTYTEEYSESFYNSEAKDGGMVKTLTGITKSEEGSPYDLIIYGGKNKASSDTEDTALTFYYDMVDGGKYFANEKDSNLIESSKIKIELSPSDNSSFSEELQPFFDNGETSDKSFKVTIDQYFYLNPVHKINKLSNGGDTCLLVENNEVTKGAKLNSDTLYCYNKNGVDEKIGLTKGTFTKPTNETTTTTNCKFGNCTYTYSYNSSNVATLVFTDNQNPSNSVTYKVTYNNSIYYSTNDNSVPSSIINFLNGTDTNPTEYYYDPKSNINANDSSKCSIPSGLYSINTNTNLDTYTRKHGISINSITFDEGKISVNNKSESSS